MSPLFYTVGASAPVYVRSRRFSFSLTNLQRYDNNMTYAIAESVFLILFFIKAPKCCLQMPHGQRAAGLPLSRRVLYSGLEYGTGR